MSLRLRTPYPCETNYARSPGQEFLERSRGERSSELTQGWSYFVFPQATMVKPPNSERVRQNPQKGIAPNNGANYLQTEDSNGPTLMLLRSKPLKDRLMPRNLTVSQTQIDTI